MKEKRFSKVAVIGISCRLPGARDQYEFMANVCNGVNSIREVGSDRWDPTVYFSSDIATPNKVISRWCGLLEDPFSFDAAFFKISPREARQLDPQQRLMLEEAWHCIEDAGVGLRELQRRRTAVYVGVMGRDSLIRAAALETSVEGHSFLGNLDFGVANRISHALGLRGASHALDAACASSLVAIHEGALALARGEADYVLAGGVHLILHPWRYISYSKARMLSPDGQCKTFDLDADGFVPGEGAALVLLCRLEDAARTRAHVYGVIRGSAVNHGGRRLTMTAPTVESQREVIRHALLRAGVGAETLGYVEAHGTGTALGDPIELEALTQVFREHTQLRQFCAIGSVKANIGHLEPAAGIAGFVKVMMLLREQRIPPTINVRSPNPLIRFETSPFHLPTEATEWKPLHQGMPLRAGISAFGAGGVNCHIVVEGPPTAAHASSKAPEPLNYPFVLSARTRENAVALLDAWRGFVRTDRFRKSPTGDICYTLATGRESYPFRLGGMISCQEDIVTLLEQAVLESKESVARGYWLTLGAVKPPPQPEFERLMRQPLFLSTLKKLRKDSKACRDARKGLLRLLDGRLGPGERCLFTYFLTRALFRSGFLPSGIVGSSEGLWASLAAAEMLSWDVAVSLAAGQPPPAIRLRRPKLPFIEPVWGRLIAPYKLDAEYLTALREQIAISEENASALLGKARLLAARQPTFRAYLSEWLELIRSHPESPLSLPALELVPASLPIDRRQAMAWTLIIQNSFERLNRKWGISGPSSVHGPNAQEVGDLLLDGILSGAELLDFCLGTHGHLSALAQKAQQRIQLLDEKKPYLLLRAHSTDVPDFGDIHEWAKRARAGGSSAVVPADAPQLLLMDDAPRQARSNVVVPAVGLEWPEKYLKLLLDLWIGGTNIRWDRWFAKRRSNRVSLPVYPFSKEAPTDRAVFGDEAPRPSLGQSQPDGARVSHTQAAAPALSGSQAAAKPEAICLRACFLPRALSPRKRPVQPRGMLLLFCPTRDESFFRTLEDLFRGWQSVCFIIPGSERHEISPRSFVIRPAEQEDYEWLTQSLAQRNERPSHVLHLWSLSSELPWETRLRERLDRGCYSLFGLTQAFVKQGVVHHIQILYIYPQNGGQLFPDGAAIEGLSRSIRREQPLIRLRSLAIAMPGDGPLPWPQLCEELQAEGEPDFIVYKDDVRLVKSYETCAPASQDQGRGWGSSPPSLRGTVLLTGGAGGIGLLVAEHLLNMDGVKVALAGRSKMTPALELKLSSLQAGKKRRLAYFQADVSQLEETRALLKSVQRELGGVSAIIHGAGIIRDSFLMRKTLAQFQETLAPKVFGAINLDEATAGQPLDTFLLFSSIAAITGNVGQADYSYANAFLDSYGLWRQDLCASRARSGRTITINWPLWDNAGMRVREGVDTFFTKARGFVPLPAAEGLHLLDVALAGPSGQTILFYGHRERLTSLLDDLNAPEETTPVPSALSPQVSVAEPALLEQTAAYLVRIFSALLGVQKDALGLDVGFEEYGIDSILISQFNIRLEEDLGSISKTILFEQRTLRQVAAYLVRQYGPALVHLFAKTSATSVASSMAQDRSGTLPAASAFAPSTATQEGGSPVVLRTLPESAFDDIAVIGMSGRYPMAANLDEFWKNLLDERDCITQIPVERWGSAKISLPGNSGATAREAGPYCKWGGFLDGVDRFDPLFFHIAPREAELMDPQERLFLQTAYWALEDAGYPPYRLGTSGPSGRRSVGVFVGVTTNTYLLLGPDGWRQGSSAVPTSLPWSIANRVSYWLDASGPSMPVDTACASSLTAVHLACESLKRGECQFALVGGVNLYLHPSKFHWLCQMNMLSRRGRCHAFGAQADGFVPGEGVGALVLRRLSDAVESGDCILAVIKGSATNHGGRTHGFTVPNPNAQAEVVTAALRNARIDPDTIGYVEAHGTGTALGDPVEIAGLNKAFRDAGYGPPWLRRCAIGSVKTNIGHLEAAAGLAGLTKIILQMKHGLLVRSLHSQQLNPQINFTETCFSVQQERARWVPIIKTERGRERQFPLRAGISSFGAGGANAHVILEQYEGRQVTAEGANDVPCLIVLSAQNRERLREHAQNIAARLRLTSEEVRLSEIAYQLQVRRQPLEERVAFIAESRRAAIEMLDAIGADAAPAARLYRGSVRGQPAGLAGTRPFTAPPSSGIDAIPRLEQLAQAFTSGLQEDLAAFYEAPLRHVDLPAYPFAPERYWVPEEPGSPVGPAVSSLAGHGICHPFLKTGTDSQTDPCFSAEFDGEEFFFADHRVNDQKIFPAVGYLEMARAAMAALGLRVCALRNNVWQAAIAIPHTRSVHIQLNLNKLGADYEVFSLDSAQARVVHGRGKVLSEPGSGGHKVVASHEELEAQPAAVNLVAIRARCPKGIGANEYYRRLAELGLQLGPSYRGITALHLGKAEALSEIVLPGHLEPGAFRFMLHPAIFDSALQGCLGLLEHEEGLRRLFLPFAMDEVTLFRRPPQRCYAHIVLRASLPEAKKLEVQLLDEDGRILTVVREFWLRPWESDRQNRIQLAAEAARSAGPSLAPGTFFRPYWSEERLVTAAPASTRREALLFFSRSARAATRIEAELSQRAKRSPAQVLFFSEAARPRPLGPSEYEFDWSAENEYDVCLELLRSDIDKVQILFVATQRPLQLDRGSWQEQIERELLPLVYLVQALVRSARKPQVRILAVLPAAESTASLSLRAFESLLLTVDREAARFTHRLINLPQVALDKLAEGKGEGARIIVDELLAVGPRATEVSYQDTRRFVKRWRELQLPFAPGAQVLRQRGTYLLSGGAKGLGLLVARCFAEQAAARLVLLGRAAADEASESAVESIRAAGGEGLYLQTDVTQARDAARAVQRAKESFGPIHGIVHCAGVLRDGFIANLGREDFRAALGPKLFGALNLDGATSQEPLDFFACFSSIAAVLGNVGQAAYALANGFLDDFAERREALRALGLRAGRTFSINWPLWRSGGMRVDRETEESLFLGLGVRALETTAGLSALTSILNEEPGVIAYAPVGAEKLCAALRGADLAAAPESGGRPVDNGPAPTPQPAGMSLDEAAARKLLLKKLFELIAEDQKIDERRLQPERPLSEYGFDSIGFTRLANGIQRRLGADVTPAMFFEYTTAASVAEALWRDHRDKLAERFGADSEPAVPTTAPPGAASVAPASAGRATPAAHALSTRVQHREPIAIIGMHGLMPQSDSLDEFWEHLEAGNDLVSEVPIDRWDWREYDGDPRKEANKTNSKWGGFLRGIDRFDARFFGISPREAELMDPQQRLFLETVYKSIEDAGYAPSELTRYKPGVFVGAGSHDYYEILRESGVPTEAYTTTGLFHAILANRISFLLNFSGPSFPIDTACSSSLVALRAAIESIWLGNCDVAIAGGVSLILSPMVYVSFARAGMLSPDGRCKTFDKSANGYVRGEGVGALLLKPLSRALEDGDNIHAIIRGSAVNHGGRVNTLTTPNPNAQAALVIGACEEGGVDPATIGYIEVHGTGTALGDPIEVNGLKKAFRELRQRAGKPELTLEQCALGSVKTNIGHLEPAAGIAGIFKSILAMKRGVIPRNLHLREINPYLQLAQSPFHVVQTTEHWPRMRDDAGNELPRRAGVSSFGFGGANGHVILEEYIPPTRSVITDEAEQLFVLSARTQEQLRQRAEHLLAYLQSSAGALRHRAARANSLEQVEQEIRQLAAELLGVANEEIFLDEDLEQIGLDKLRTNELWQRACAAYGRPRSPQAEASCRSLSEIAAHISAGSPMHNAAGERGGSQPEVPGDTPRLIDLAYTLQVGREPMEHRMAVVAGSIKMLIDTLRRFIDHADSEADLYCGQVELASPGASDGELPSTDGARRLVENRSEQLRIMARSWVRGHAVSWLPLYEAEKPQRLALPAYPFARTRHSIPRSLEHHLPGWQRRLHPMLDGLVFAENSPETQSLTFRKRLDGQARILRDHRVQDAAVLPGVAHLEMAWAAISLVHKGPFRLTNVVWLKPLMVPEAGEEVVLQLTRVASRISYELRSAKEGPGSRYSKGQAEEFTPKTLHDDLAVIRSRCPLHLSASKLYEHFGAAGIAYGPYFRGIREAWLGQKEALSFMEVPGNDQRELRFFTLHPTLADAALQTIAAIDILQGASNNGARLPFSAAAVELLRPLESQGFAHARLTSEDCYDVTIYNGSGEACLVFREVHARGEQPRERDFFYIPEWKEEPLGPDLDNSTFAAAGDLRPSPARDCLIVHPPQCFDLDQALARLHAGQSTWRVMLGTRTQQLGHLAWEIDARDPQGWGVCLQKIGLVQDIYFLGGIRTKTHPFSPNSVLDDDADGELALYRLLRALSTSAHLQAARTLRVVVNDAQDIDGRRIGNPRSGGLIGFSKSIAKEFPHLAVSCLDIGVPVCGRISEEERLAIAAAIREEPRQRGGEEVAFLRGRRHIKLFRPAELPAPRRPAFRNAGTYLIVGGAGGIGLQLATHLLQSVRARVAIVGRRPNTPELDRNLEALSKLGGEAVYVRADVADYASMSAAVAHVEQRFGVIHGVIHSAMVLYDAIVENMREEAMKAALAPKVAGSMVLGALFREKSLDFMLFLSSVQSFLGAAGQSNYAAACTASDAIARSLASQARFPVKIINWGYFGTIGRVASESYRSKLASQGFHSISPEEGLRAIELILSSDERQVVALKAEPKVLAQLGVLPLRVPRAKSKTPPQGEAESQIPQLFRTSADEEELQFFEEFIAQSLWHKLQAALLAQPLQVGTYLRREELLRRFGVIPKYHQLFGALLGVLARQKVIREKTASTDDPEPFFGTASSWSATALEQRESALRTRHQNLSGWLELAIVCLRALPDVLRGTVPATEVLFPRSSLGLLRKVYRGEKLVDYCNELVAHSLRAFLAQRGERKDPATTLAILEIGAGTGSTTTRALAALGEARQQIRYDFTDISPRFLVEAKREFSSEKLELRFLTLDIEKDPLTQGFMPGDYDVIIAANVMHATRDLDAALLHVRRLLKPGGWLILNEITRVQSFHLISFGLLDGWWNVDSEHRRLPYSPLLDAEMWKRRLELVGFMGISVLGESTQGGELEQRVLLAEEGMAPSRSLPASPASPAQSVSLAEKEVEMTADRTLNVSATNNKVSEPVPDRFPFDAEPYLRELITKAAAACLGMQPSEIGPDKPFSSLGVDSIVGVELVNQIGQELGIVLKTILVFDYPTVTLLARHVADSYILELSQKQKANPVGGNPPLSAPLATTPASALAPPRASEEAPSTADVREELNSTRNHRPSDGAFSASSMKVTGTETGSRASPLPYTQGPFFAVRFEQPGSPQALKLVPVQPREPGDLEVEILVRAFPINFSDFLLAKGLYPIMPDFPFTPGVEVSGVIRRVGPRVTRFKIGDEVIALTRLEMGGQAALVITDEDLAAKKPAHISFTDACGFPVAFLAMYLAFERAQVRAKERIFIQAATGTNGLIALQLARLLDAEIYATAGSPQKLEFLKQMGISQVFDHNDPNLAELVNRRTNNRGVDVVISTMGGAMLQTGLDVLAPEGRYVELAVFGLQAAKGVSLSRFVNNQSFFSLNAKKFFLQHKELRQHYLGIMESHLASGKVRPFTAAVFEFDRIRDAYKKKEARETIGRVVVSLPEAQSPTAETAKPPSKSSARKPPLDIAIVGMACRFPGANSPQELWQLLKDGRSQISEVPSSRWSAARYYHADPSRLDKTYCKRGGFLEEIDKFDPSFFSISGKEAAQTDPQQRIFLEEAWAALEDAGYTADELSGRRCGVFVGAGASDYLTRMNKAGVLKEAQAFWGNEASIIPARISYFLNLKGPSVAINTACSSSLVAIHLACQSILVGDCEMALAGGVFLITAPDYFVVASNGNMLSREGRCKTFDDSADGFGPGEGVGVVVLMPLERALAENAHIYGIVKASAINQDGTTNGITAPSSLSQTDVQLLAYEGYGISPESIGYVEAHGTGTRLGDPIEIEALTRTFQKYTNRRQFCPIGSIKTNIGHTAAAAGVAGILKILLSFQQEKLPASLNFQKQNRHIDFANSPFFVNQELRDWPRRSDEPRRAAVSSYGFSGTNAHMVLEEPPIPGPSTLKPRLLELIPLSAESPHALWRRVVQLLGWLKVQGSTHPLTEIACNLQVYRSHLSQRCVFAAREPSHLIQQLERAASLGPEGAWRSAPSGLDAAQSALVAEYLRGQIVDWRREHPDGHCLRLSLPTYPFEKERYWYVENDTVYSDAADSPEIGAGNLISDAASSQGIQPPSYPPREGQAPDLLEQLRRLAQGELDEDEALQATEALLGY